MLASAIHYLTTHPAARARLVAEVDAFGGEAPGHEDLARFPYVEVGRDGVWKGGETPLPLSWGTARAPDCGGLVSCLDCARTRPLPFCVRLGPRWPAGAQKQSRKAAAPTAKQQGLGCSVLQPPEPSSSTPAANPHTHTTPQIQGRPERGAAAQPPRLDDQPRVRGGRGPGRLEGARGQRGIRRHPGHPPLGRRAGADPRPRALLWG